MVSNGGAGDEERSRDPAGAGERAGEPHEHSHDHHEHEHRRHGSHSHGHGSSAGRLGLSLIVTSGVMLAEAIGGWLSGSLALLSDAGHMLTDVAALALALLAVVFGARPADAKRTFGYRRLEVLAAQVNVALLLGITGWIIWEAIERFRNRPQPIALGTMAVVATIGLAANVVILFWLRHEQSLNARSAFLHVLGDTVSSLAVLLGAVVMWLQPGLWWVDPALSMGIALLVLWGVVRLVFEITDILMEAAPAHLDVAKVCQVMESARGVDAVHDLHIWTISSDLCALSAHLVVHSESMGRNDDILSEVKARLRREFGITHTTLQIESAEYDHADELHPH